MKNFKFPWPDFYCLICAFLAIVFLFYGIINSPISKAQIPKPNPINLKTK